MFSWWNLKRRTLGVLFFAFVVCWSFSTAYSFADTIIDNRDPETSQTGEWLVSGGTSPYDADSVWARGGDDTFTWHFTPTESGNYEVWEWHSGWSSRTTGAPHQITYAGGNKSVIVNQRVNAGQWNSLGVYPFVAGVSYGVTVISVADSSSTCADAMRWTLVTAGPSAPIAYIDSITPNPADEGETITFTGHGIDTDGSIVAYRWISSINGILSASASFSISTLSVGTHTISLEVQDNDGAWSAPVTQNLFVIGTPGTSTEVIIDNRDANTSQTGEWPVSGGTSPYDADSVWARGGDDTFTWYFNPTESGNYEVWEWHSGWSSRTSAAPHQITYAGGNQTISVNQKVNAGQWNNLGVYPFVAGGSYGVTVTSVADSSSTCADAIRWTLVTAGPSAPIAYIDSITPNPANEGETITFTGHGNDTDGSIVAYRWISSIDGPLSTSASFSISTLSVGTHTISFEVQDNDGAWSVPVTQSLSVNSPSTPTAYIDSITPNPADEGETISFAGHGIDTDGSIVAYRWISSIDGPLSTSASFSRSTLSVGTHTISFEVQDNDGAWSAPVTQSLFVIGTPGTSIEVIIDNRDPETSHTGEWLVSGASEPYDPNDPEADSVWSRDGATFTYHFTPPQTDVYEPSLWWTQWSSRSKSVPVDIEHTGGTTRIYINQKKDGGQWNIQGEYYFEAGLTYDIIITSQPNPTSTCADAIRFRQFDSYVAYGDSITKGYGDDFALDDTSQDGRDTGGGFEPVLNDLLTAAMGIPHRIANEGYGGRTSSYGLSMISEILSNHPESERFLVQWGTNDGDPFFAVPSGLGKHPGDSGYPGSFKDNMQQIINTINSAGKEVCLAKLPIVLGDDPTGAQYPDPENPPVGSRGAFVIEYNLVIDELKNDLSNNINIEVPDFWTLFIEDIGGVKRYESEYYDNLHPNGTGYRSMANSWFEVLTP